MVGYGPEDDHFVIELTYNYGIKSYQRGNDYHVMVICIHLLCTALVLSVVYVNIFWSQLYSRKGRCLAIY